MVEILTKIHAKIILLHGIINSQATQNIVKCGLLDYVRLFPKSLFIIQKFIFDYRLTFPKISKSMKEVKIRKIFEIRPKRLPGLMSK